MILKRISETEGVAAWTDWSGWGQGRREMVGILDMVKKARSPVLRTWSTLMNNWVHGYWH